MNPQDLEKDFYAALGVTKSASQKEIKTAYRKLAQEYHPDKHPGDEAAEEKFKEISHAYDVIGDEAKRKEYDEGRELFAAGAFAGGGRRGGFSGGGGGFPGGIRFEDLGGFSSGQGGYDSIFDLFGSSAGSSGPRRGSDLESSINLGFSDALEGVTTTLTVTSDASCQTCHGSGARPGTLPETCPNCRGSGLQTESQGPFGLSRPCTICGGSGQIIKDPCPTCRGSGVERRPRNIKVKIPAGVEDGKRIRLKGKGAPGSGGGPSGDLYITVHVAAHPIFGRKGSNLTLSVPVTFPELALGSQIRVPTMNSPVTIKVPAGTPPGRTFKVKGRGAAKKGGGHGDLLVTVEAAVPQKLRSKEKAALEEFAKLHDESPRDYLDQYMEA